MKNKAGLIVGILLVLILAWLIVPGLIRNTSVFIRDYTVSAGGKEITIRAGVASSVGTVREMTVRRQQDGKLYLDFFSAFGGINGRIGAKDTFTVPLDEDTSVIAVNRDGNRYEEILVKETDGSWCRGRRIQDVS